MIQFHLSKKLAKDMKMHVQSKSKINPQAMQWYANVVTLARRKCVIAMELQSRYTMVFCGMTKKEFEHFPEIFQERLWREVLVLCTEEENEEFLNKLSNQILSIANEQRYQEGHDRSVTSHMNQVVQSLEIYVQYQGNDLPESSAAAYEFGVRENKIIRKRKSDKDYFRPAEVFRDFWLGLLDFTENGSGPGGPTNKDLESNNIIYVNFDKKE